MKGIVQLLLLAVLALVIGCTEEDSTAPETGDDYTLEGTETIGPAGGTFAIEDFSLTVPAGAFDADYDLELYASSEDQPFGESSISRTFRVVGLPGLYYQPLHTSIGYEGALSEGAYVAVGEEVFAPSLAGLTAAYHLFSAEDSSGYLICDLPVRDATGVASPPFFSTPAVEPENAIRVGGVTGRLPYESPEGHFTITAPSPSIAWAAVEEAGNCLEAAYTEFSDMLGFSYEARTRWPIEVTVRDLSADEAAGLFYPSEFGINYSHMALHNSLLETVDDGLRAVSGHEFFHFVQSLYDPRNTSEEASGASTQYWLNEATASWSEELFTVEADYVPPQQKDNAMAPFDGMHKGGALEDEDEWKIVEAHGYGMSAAIKYLVSRYGDAMLLNMYKEIRDGAHPLDAVIANAGDPQAWFEPFLTEYVSGNVYDAQPEVWIDNSHGDFLIESDEDTLKTFSYNYPDLSARIYAIELKHHSIDTGATIRFTVSGGEQYDSAITVFETVAFGYPEEIGYGFDQVSIPNVRALTDENANLFALVTNSRAVPPYTGTSDIDLEVKVIEAGQAPAYNRCHVGAAVYGHIQRVWGETTTDYYEHWTCATPFAYPEGVEGSFSGNTFTGSYDKGGAQGTVVITLDADQSVVTNVTWTEADAEGEVTHQLEFIGTNVPKIEPYLADLEYFVQGAETGSHIPALTYASHDAVVDLHFTLLGYECDENSLLAVWLWEQ
jgi:hypothetical protein